MVTIDIDGTLTSEHGWRPIAAARGRMREYEHSRRALLAKREDEDTHLTRLFELAEGLDRVALDALLDGTRRVRGIPETVARLHALGARVPLLTHNPGFVIQWYSRKFGFDGGSGGWGLSMRNGIVQRPGRVRADKVRGLRAIRRRFPAPPWAICHIGDAWPDARLAPLIGGFIAFNPKSTATARAADATLSSGDLREVLPILGRLRPRRPLNDARPLLEPSNSRAAGTA
jgi:phosphoserine phosphatase